MRTYKRIKIEGGGYFFTVVLTQRQGNNLLIQHVDTLRESVKQIQKNHPFTMDAVVILPDHLHCIWQLPENDANFSSRWQLIESYFSRSITATEYISKSRQHKHERGLWQRRFWEHPIGVSHRARLEDAVIIFSLNAIAQRVSALGDQQVIAVIMDESGLSKGVAKALRQKEMLLGIREFLRGGIGF